MASTMTFGYRVRDREGRLHEGKIEADSRSLVASRLREMGYTPIEITEGASKGVNREITIPGLSNRVKLTEIALLSRQLATMVDAGLTLVRALGVVADQATNPALVGAVTAVRLEVEQGSSLSAALAAHPKVFSDMYVAMVRAGETGGSLDEILKRVADTLEAQAGLRREVKSAMAYPSAVVGLVVVIMTAMLLFIVPIFKRMYDSLGGKLPAPTVALLAVSHVLVSSSYLVAAGIAAVVIGLRRWKKTPRGRMTMDRLSLKLPVFGKLIHKTAIARFSRTFAALVRSGVPILETLEIAGATTGNEMVADVVRATRVGVARGEPIARGLEGSPLIPPLVTQMIAVGEESGALDTMLDKIAAFYDAEVKAMVKALTSLLEPLLIVVVGSCVGAMVISLYLPIFNVAKLIH